MAHPGQDELQAFLAQHPALENFDLLLPDINGMLRGVRAPRADMARIFRNGAYMSASTMLLDSRGLLPDGLAIGLQDGDPDYACLPVPGTLAPLPWSRRPMGQCLLQMYEQPGEPYHYDSRRVLQRVLERYRESELTPVIALEFEFYLLDDRPGEPPRPRSQRIPGSDLVQASAQLHSLDELQDLDPFLEDVETACAAQRIPIGEVMSEGSPGQCEINLHHIPDAERACDHGILLRRLVRAVARRHDLAATFMAQPFTGLDGSGMHVHFSLLDSDGRNLFAGRPPADRPDAYAPELRHAVGGLLDTLPEAVAILAPNANSYRRLVPGSFLTSSRSWGYNHRQVAVRIPPSDEANVRLEYRPAGADCNPYLAVAAILAGAHHGLSRKTEPPPLVRESSVLPESSAESAPHWEGALARLEASAVLRDYLGRRFCDAYLACRRREAEQYRAQVPDVDLAWYLGSI